MTEGDGMRGWGGLRRKYARGISSGLGEMGWVKTAARMGYPEGGGIWVVGAG